MNYHNVSYANVNHIIKGDEMKIARIFVYATVFSLTLPVYAVDHWKNLGFRFVDESLREKVFNKASKAAIGEDKAKVGVVTIIEAGDIAEYSLVALSKSGKDRTHELLARLATNSLWHLAEPVLKKIIHDKSTWKNTELFFQTVAKYVIYFVIEPHIPN